MTTAITAASWTVAGTGSSIRAANARDTFLLFLTDIKNCRAQDQYNKSNNEEVLHRRLLLLQCVFLAFRTEPVERARIEVLL